MFSDLGHIIRLAKLAHEVSVFRDFPVNIAMVQRNFVTAMEFDNGYAKIVEDKGKVIGALVGIISENQFGAKFAQDMLCYSSGLTDRLIEDFTLWAKVRGANFVQITDLTENTRYQKLCGRLGFENGGQNFVKVM